MEKLAGEDLGQFVGTLLAFATFGAGFFARPLGRVLFGEPRERVLLTGTDRGTT